MECVLSMSNFISIEDINKINPKGIILSGGPNSVYEQNAPNCDKKIFNLGIPIPVSYTHLTLPTKRVV